MDAERSLPLMPIEPCVFTDEVNSEFEEAVQLSVEAGATAMEIRGRLPGGSITTISNADVEMMQAILAKFNARVGSLGSPFGKCDMENAEELGQHQRYFDRMLQLAEMFDTPIIRGFALWKPKETGPETERPDLTPYLDRIAEFLTPAVRKAEAAGVFLCLENEPSTMVGTCREARQVMDAVGGSPALAVAWDVNNGVYCGEPVLAEGYPLIRGRVRHVHVKPNREKHMDTVAGSTDTYEAVFRALLADGYNGCASIEHWGSPELMLRGVEELVATLERLV
jgi:sugar phosphate isomerase/epimerase